MYPFSCVLCLRQIARYLPHHRSKNASKTHPKSSHDKFKTASNFLKINVVGMINGVSCGLIALKL